MCMAEILEAAGQMPNYWKIDPNQTGWSRVSRCLVRVYVKQSLSCGYRLILLKK